MVTQTEGPFDKVEINMFEIYNLEVVEESLSCDSVAFGVSRITGGGAMT